MEKQIMIGIPINRWLSAQFAISLQRITHWMINNGWTVDVNYDNGSVLSMQRNKIINVAHKSEMDLLFVDSDMVFDERAVAQILPSDATGMIAGGDLVGGLCFMRRFPFQAAVFAHDKVDEDCVFSGMRMMDMPVYPFRVAAVGCAFLYIPHITIDTILKTYQQPFNHIEMKNGQHLGEDLSFFHRCNELGLITICCPDTEIGHITERVITRKDHLTAIGSIKKEDKGVHTVGEPPEWITKGDDKKDENN